MARKNQGRAEGELPVGNEPQPEGKVLAGENSETGPRILLIEDDPEPAAGLEEFLSLKAIESPVQLRERRPLHQSSRRDLIRSFLTSDSH